MRSEKEWYFLIEGEYENNGVFASFYCRAEEIGKAIDIVKPLAKQEGISNIKFIETTRIDIIEDYEHPESCIDLNQQVKMMQAFNLYELNQYEYLFTPPVGIIFDSKEGEYDTDLIKEHFVAYTKNENGIFEFELVVDENRLDHIFFITSKFLQTVDGFWIWINEHWNEKPRQLYFNEKLSTADDITTFLKENTSNTMENGFIDIVLHSKEGATNLTLNEHKKISLHTKSEKVFNDFIGKVIGLGFDQTRNMYDIEFGYHHWHYKPGRAYDREDFCNFLKQNNFKEVSNAM